MQAQRSKLKPDIVNSLYPTATNLSQFNFPVLALRSEMIPSCYSMSGLAIQQRLVAVRKYNWQIIRWMWSSLIATVEGVVDVVTGVWWDYHSNGPNNNDDGNTVGVDVRHCKGSSNKSFLERSWFKLGRELSTIEILRASHALYTNLSASGVRVTDCLVGRR